MEHAVKQHINSSPAIQRRQKPFGKKAEPSFFSPAFIQPKLSINQPNDIYEQEADAVADKVMRMSDKEIIHTKSSPPVIQTKCATCEEEEKLQRKENDEKEESKVQLKPIADLPVQRKCEHCEEEEKNKQAVQLKPVPGISIQRKCTECEEEEQVHRKESGNSSSPAISPSVHQTLQSSGNPLDAGTRSFMESRFNYDFSKVQIHDNAQAHQSSRDINARAYAHGQHIVFASGQYQPNTHTGKQLLAHELTHVVQQNASMKAAGQPNQIQRAPFKGGTQQGNYGVGNKNIDIRGKSKFRLGKDFSEYLAFFFTKGLKAPITVSYGNMGSGTIFITPRILAFSEGCNYKILITPFAPIIFEECAYYFDAGLSFYDAAPQVVPFELPGLDTSAKNGTLALKVEISGNDIVSNEINSGDTNRALGWVAGETKNSLGPYDYASADFSREAFLPFIYGKDYDGKNFSGFMYTNHMSGGYLIFNSVGGLALANQQSLYGLIQLGDTNNWWHTTLTTKIMGSKDYELPIDRTDKGDLTGEGDGLTLDETWTGKGFKAKGKLQVSYVNSNFFVLGTASYESKRAKGDLLIVVADYTTAKRYATEYLPEDIAKKSKTDPPPNPADRLAFAGAGNISFTLFDGNKESRAKTPAPKDVIGDEPEPQTNRALQADASFVVEPEGYITIAGQVQTQEKEFVLFPETKPPYQKKIPIVDITIARIPGPLATSADFKFKVNLVYGATIGPLTLSEIKAQGLYSSRPDTASELELSVLIKLLGKLFVNLEVCVSLEGSLLGIFSIELLEYCLHGGIAAVGAIQARPTIQVVSPAKDPDRSTPPEYYIRGSFNFDAAGQLIFQLGDSFTINLTKEESKDPATKDPKDPAKDKDVQKEWKYKKNRKTVKNTYGSKDVEIPMDHTLGSEEIPRVSLKNFIKDNLKERLTKLITQDRPPERKYEKEYFEPGKDIKGKAAPASDDKHIKEGGYEEQGEERGNIVEDTKPVATKPDQIKFVFDEDFFMNGYRHKLSLIISQINKAAAIDFESVLMMESELEEISEKIEEEKKDIQDHPDPAADFKKKDIAGIESEAKRIKGDARKLGINDELSNKPQYPALKGMAVSIHNYGDRYKKKDFGVPDQTIQPKCSKPADVHAGQEIIFPKYTSDDNIGRVIEVVSYVSKDRNLAFWHIKFRPYGARSGKILAPPAYDENCNPTYYIAKAKNCEGIEIKMHEKIVPERIINKTSYPQRYKADWVKAYPLCWGDEQLPKDALVGMDRIHSNKQAVWHRAHLVHSKMGGPGTRWNLVPVPKHINNDVMPAQFENKLKDLVQNGISTGKQYWFEARIEYHQSEDNAVIGNYSDFVKEINVYFGELNKNAQGAWEFSDDGVLKANIKLDRIPFRDELAPNRVQG